MGLPRWRKNLPFETGQFIESRSFVAGYRGAWFRCKINDIGSRKGQMAHLLEFIDFPDEKIRWTKLFQKLPTSIRRQLMVRPQYPPMYRENQVPDISTISEVIVIVDDVWKVGDLVDWWTDGAYWSGKITGILEDEKVQIELPPPPFGEEMSCEASYKDLRPSLDWSPESGWMVPIATENENVRRCAQVIKPVNQGLLQDLTVHTTDKDRNSVQAPVGKLYASFSSPMFSSSQSQPADNLGGGAQRLFGDIASKDTQTPRTDINLDIVDSSIGETSDINSSPHARDAVTEIAGTSKGTGGYNKIWSPKKKNIDISLNSMCSDTLEAAILDLEELVSRVKWIRGMLELGVPLPNAKRPCWKFLEHRASATPK